MVAEPHKSAGPTPWFDLVFDHCEDQGGFLAVESFPIGPLEEAPGRVCPNAEFVLLAYWGDVCKGTTPRGRRLEALAEDLARQFDLHFADA